MLKFSERELGAEHQSTLKSMTNLTRTYSDQGQWKKIEKLELQVLDISERTLEAEHPSTLRRMANLASTYSDQGQWNKVEKLELQVLEISKRTLGAEHSSTLTSMINLTGTYKILRFGLDKIIFFSHFLLFKYKYSSTYILQSEKATNALSLLWLGFAFNNYEFDLHLLPPLY